MQFSLGLSEFEAHFVKELLNSEFDAEKYYQNFQILDFLNRSFFLSVLQLNLSLPVGVTQFLVIADRSRAIYLRWCQFQPRRRIVDKLPYISYQGKIFQINLLSSSLKLHPVKIFCALTRIKRWLFSVSLGLLQPAGRG